MSPSRSIFFVVLTVVGLSCVLLASGDASAQKSLYDRGNDPHEFHLFMHDGGWCWFQDPRVIVHRGRLVIGGVEGNGSGDAVVGIFDMTTKKPTGRVILHSRFKHDDHNSPVFFARPDGSVLAVYALHGNNRTHYYRLSNSRDLLHWGAEKQFDHEYPNAGNVTYMNLNLLKDEGKLYNFFRGIEFNPSFITSTDHGLTWNEPTHFIDSELAGRHRPYARYAGNGTDTVHVSFTDGHPDQFGNSIYYAAFRNGAFFSADGKMIKRLGGDGPLKPSEAEAIFRGGGQWAKRGPASAERSAWTSSIAVDDQAHPHIAYSLHLSDEDHRYRLASWDGSKWLDREIAHAGSCLYSTQTSYTGLISLDPIDPSYVVISTDVDPTTGKTSSGRHEVYRARVWPEDDVSRIKWEPLTRNSPVRNLRPVVVAGDGFRAILWLRGEYLTYTQYDLDVVGLIEPLE